MVMQALAPKSHQRMSPGEIARTRIVIRSLLILAPGRVLGRRFSSLALQPSRLCTERLFKRDSRILSTDIEYDIMKRGSKLLIPDVFWTRREVKRNGLSPFLWVPNSHPRHNLCIFPPPFVAIFHLFHSFSFYVNLINHN